VAIGAMPELVLGPDHGQLAVHTPFLMRTGADVYLFYCRCDLDPDGSVPRHRQFRIFVARQKDDGSGWDLDHEPAIAMRSSVCRPWVVATDGGWRMYFVRSLPPFASASRIYAATSRNLTQWEVREQPLIEPIDRRELQGSPCLVPDGERVRLYFSAGSKGCQGDDMYLAEGPTEDRLKVNGDFRVDPGEGYRNSRFAPFVYIAEGKWRMLFTGRDEEKGRYRTFLAESEDGVRFGPGRLALDLAGDSRFEHGAYKAVLFEGWMYFVGVDGTGHSAVYRLPMGRQV